MKLGYLSSEYEKAGMERYRAFKLAPALTEIPMCALVAVDGNGDLVKADASTGMKAEGFVFIASVQDPYGAVSYNVAPSFANIGTREYRRMGMMRKGFATIYNDNGDELSSYFKMKDVVLTGTVATTDTDATVTGTGTKFTTELIVGDYITIADVGTKQVLSIASDTSLELTALAGTTATGKKATALNAYGNPLYLAEDNSPLPFTMLVPTTNKQLVGRVDSDTVIEYDIAIEMV